MTEFRKTLPTNLYILKYRKPIPCNDLMKWGKWFENTHRRVRRTQINEHLFISTVFLGIDHGWNDNLELFETMVFKNGEGQDCYRCDTWRNALKQHWEIVRLVSNDRI